MDVRRHLEQLDRDQIIEVSYLVGRYLTHSIGDAAFERMFRADSPSNIGIESYERSIELVRSIEASERKPIKEFDRTLRNHYMLEIATAAKELATAQSHPALLDDIRNELTTLRF